jgi:CDP-glucose 4,6-dehydratase
MFNDFYKNRSVFLTGHTGFKGAWLAAWLTRLGARVTGYALPPAYENSLFDLLKISRDLNHIEGDVRDADRLSQAIREAKPEVVFHLAAQALVREGYRDPKTTFDVNVGGSVNVLEAVRRVDCVRAVVFVTSDKCYENLEWDWGYRENDRLGGKDPYAASKACAEIALRAYRESFFSGGDRGVNVASARAGNCIGGGDWAADRIVPDCMRALIAGKPITLRNPRSVRPWQHVLDPLAGYLLLGVKLCGDSATEYCCGWNFGPDRRSYRTARELADEIVLRWGRGEIETRQDRTAPREHGLLFINWDKAFLRLGWAPVWSLEESAAHTTQWYKSYAAGENMTDVTLDQLERFLGAWNKR